MDFYIMNKDCVAAKWQSGKLEMLNEALLPLYLQKTANVEKWLETRAIDSHRANSRLIKSVKSLASLYEPSFSINL